MTTHPLLPAARSGEPARALSSSIASGTATAQRVVENVCRVVRGHDQATRLVACALLAGGHALVEDTPGTGKTTLARAFARSLGGSFSRVQATADLLPSDITGSGIWDPQERAFVFVPGPVFAHVVLADELNRTPPRTQSAFLEAMEEAAVTVDGIRHALPDPFFVIATQNPLEQYGTFPLPEGQLDRFAVALSLGPLDLASERLVVREQLARATVDDLDAVVQPDELAALQLHVRGLHVSDSVLDYALALVQATRENPRVLLGASPRAALALVRCAQAHALLAGRDFVLPDDVKALTQACLRHRLVLAEGDNRGASDMVIGEVLAAVPVPVLR